MSSTPDCPECVQGKHGNCDGTSWNPKADDVDACPCAERGHHAQPLTSDERAAYQSMVARGVNPAIAREEALDGVEVDEVRRIGTAALGDVPQCNGRCGVQGYGEDAHPDFDDDCPLHGTQAEDRELCPDGCGGVEIVERSIETSGYEEQERYYHVTRLSCGHEIAVEVKGRAL